MSRIVQFIFPCVFDEPKCRTNRWGCRCGKRRRSLFRSTLFGSFPERLISRLEKKGSASKTEERTADLARQTKAEATAATALDPQEDARRQLAFDLLNQQVPFLTQRARATPGELFTQLGPTASSLDALVRQRLGQGGEQLFGGISPAAAQLQSIIQQRLGQTGEQLFGGVSPTAARLQGIIQNRLQNFPQIQFEDTLRPELELLRQQVGAFANRRGTTGSGLELEHLGRTGAELVIRQAALRQQNALVNQQLQQQAIANAQGLVSGQEALGAQARGEASGLVGSQEALLNQARGEAGGIASSAAALGAGARGELASTLQDIESLSQSDRARAVGGQLRGLELAQPFELTGLGALQQREQQSRQLKQAIAQALGAAGLGAVTGGIGAAAFPTLGLNAGQGALLGSGFGGRVGNLFETQQLIKSLFPDPASATTGELLDFNRSSGFPASLGPIPSLDTLSLLSPRRRFDRGLGEGSNF